MRGDADRMVLHPSKINDQLIYWGAGSWGRQKSKSDMICALCGRRIRRGGEYLKAVFPATGGIYVQAYHTECGNIRCAVGYQKEFASHMSATQWAEDRTCFFCENRFKCRLNGVSVFDCPQAVRALKLGADE